MSGSPTSPRLPGFLQVFLCLGIFLALAFSFTSVFELPIQLALFSAWFVVMGLGIYLGHQYTDLEAAAVDGITKGMGAIFILLAVGALVGTWIAGGIVPSIIYYGLTLIHPSIFLLATLIICSLTSLATGTSWGSAATAGIAMMGIGQSLGVPAPLVAGAVLSGVYFGDKLSPLSDSVVLASTMSNVDVVTHIKGMLPISGLSYVITALLFTLAGFQYAGDVNLSQVDEVIAALDQQFKISPLSLIPVIIVLGLLARKKPAFPVISMGALLGLIWAIGFQGMDPIAAIQTAYSPAKITSGTAFIDEILNRGGMESMLGSVAVIIFGLGLGNLLDKVGILTVIAQKCESQITTPGNITVYTLLTAFFANVFGAAMYVSLILTPKIMAKNYDRLGLHRKNLSRNAEFGGTLTSGMVPWSDNGIFMAGLLGVATLDYLPYMWLSFSCIIITVSCAYLGLFIERVTPLEEEAALPETISSGN